MTTHDWEALLDGATPYYLAAEEAVAEVIRLRGEIAEMRDDWEHAAERTAALVALWPNGHRATRYLRAAQAVANRLSRILEGDTNE